MKELIDPMVWALGAGAIVACLLCVPELADMVTDMRPGKWASVR